MKSTPDPLPVEEFLYEMEGIRNSAMQQIMSGKYGQMPLANGELTEARKRPEVIFLLQLGIYPEYREVHLLCRQMDRLDDMDFIYRVGKQIADESKHAWVLRKQLLEWGADPDRFWQEPIYQWSAAFDYMDKLTHPVVYFACSNFIGEGLFLPSIMVPMKKYDPETFTVYVEHILPDEPSHILIGRDIIVKYCTTYEMQERVRRAAATIAKQYCIGFDAATQFATRAKQGEDLGWLRDGPVCLPNVNGSIA